MPRSCREGRERKVGCGLSRGFPTCREGRGGLSDLGGELFQPWVVSVVEAWRECRARVLVATQLHVLIAVPATRSRWVRASTRDVCAGSRYTAVLQRTDETPVAKGCGGGLGPCLGGECFNYLQEKGNMPYVGVERFSPLGARPDESYQLVAILQQVEGGKCVGGRLVGGR